jgi:hypothetical protein
MGSLQLDASSKRARQSQTLDTAPARTWFGLGAGDLFGSDGGDRRRGRLRDSGSQTTPAGVYWLALTTPDGRLARRVIVLGH